ncbi:hypothetical protein [Streptosporangium vulgare]|uniref:hypothetical protein n=1 Tax=Streptosporangium vulgare TaxID=46190 RepID=UPI0031DC53DD
MDTRPDSPVESAAYFSISELLTNAARHGGAERVWIDISTTTTLRRGGHRRRLGGRRTVPRQRLPAGIERRLAAFDVGARGEQAARAARPPPAFDCQRPPERQRPDCRPSLPRGKAIIVGICWGSAGSRSFPQGRGGDVMKIFGAEHRSWFLALYLPELLRSGR